MDEQAIRFWSVAGRDRLVGDIYNRPGTADGTKMMTSPVIEVRFMGEPPLPIAITRSGTQYWLGDPAQSFGAAAAEEFVHRLSRDPEDHGESDPLNSLTLPLARNTGTAVENHEHTKALLVAELKRWRETS